MGTVSVRKEVIEFLRAELVGPRPGLPFVQLNGEEVLPPDDPPKLRYSAGILFPSGQDISIQEDDEDSEPAQEDSDEDNLLKVKESRVTGDTDHRLDERGEGQSENDHEVTRANEFLPCALGLTCLVRLTGKITIMVNAGQYEEAKIPGSEFKKKDGTVVTPSHWFRNQIAQTVELDTRDLKGSPAKVLPIDIDTVIGGTKLQLHILSRSIEGKADDNSELRFVTFTLINRTSDTALQGDKGCFFQCSMSLKSEVDTDCFREYPEKSIDAMSTPEDLSMELLYRHRKVYAVGHGCSADWKLDSGGIVEEVFTSSLPEYEIRPILPTSLNEIDLTMYTLSQNEEVALGNCRGIADGYDKWINQLKEELKAEVPNHLQKSANDNLSQCETCLHRIRRGIEILESNDLALQAFFLMNRAMLMQHSHYELASQSILRRKWKVSGNNLVLESAYEEPDYESSGRAWRPFQIAFVLMTLGSIVLDNDEDLAERNLVDLIWFPTGGGKTEAYLGLTAFTIFYRRLSNPGNAGTTALMRYTLRLLTTQQYQRAASLICAAETIRRQNRDELGDIPISIGLWVGGSVTSNSEKVAVDKLNLLLRGEKENPFIITTCPWCGAQMGPVKHGRRTVAKGYRKLTGPNRVRLICEDADCDFSGDEGLPLKIIDEHIYSEPPTLLVGTVDKFALLPWYPRAKKLFGIGIPEFSPPDLVIQDELHLISGPLGSMVGHYETVIDALCRNGTVPVKIVAATATISRASEQIKNLYGGRGSCLFPPQALQAGDSYFAEERNDLPGRKYIGVFATGLPSLATTEVRVLSSLLQAPKLSEPYEDHEIDPYWTLMVYFNSIRELGHAATLIRADISEYMSVTWRRLGLGKEWGELRSGLRRFINSDMELTSRVQNSEITEYMDELFEIYTKENKTYPVDICIATNMIQVGLDIPRLGLMTIVGQPKTVSEYIQASSRVGRSGDGPGLVVTLLSPAKPRDRSHAEQFKSFHQSIYKFVEPTSVTPFSIPVVERALHALIVTLTRYWSDDENSRFPVPPASSLEERIRVEIIQRVSNVDKREVDAVTRIMDEFFEEWNRLPPAIWGNFNPNSDTVPLMYPSGQHPYEEWDDRAIPTPSSMRNVDASCNAKVITHYTDGSE
jgi:hypothetical protein